jgi:hypothetical protein
MLDASLQKESRGPVLLKRRAYEPTALATFARRRQACVDLGQQIGGGVVKSAVFDADQWNRGSQG